MSNSFALDSQELLENGQVKTVLDACPLLAPIETSVFSFGDSIVEVEDGRRSVSLNINILGQSPKDPGAYVHVKSLYDWLCAATPFDWELFTAYESEETPNRYRPTERFPEPDLPFDDETDIYVIDQTAMSVS
ncbi:hypothetical protein [Corynebacterium aquilae]|uniref:Uncharacterized protein n=1 Tax=Corynebacterium aquilae DSM 44791 TaxID=1431546 RepID=A0A1L7CHD9_9CORY|nr:hypothetical protein [Corynebacterium aquilae]APT85163.1 hypothetical protein CAQU_08860 [Corynebacterium aquilae DSM 44791]